MRPERSTVPPLGSSAPARIERSVDLPAPFGPTSATTSPAARSTSVGAARRDVRSGARSRAPTRSVTVVRRSSARPAPPRQAAALPDHGSKLMRSEKNSQTARPGGEQRQREQRARQAVQLGARAEPEDHEQRVQAQRVAHHVRHDDVALDLVDAEEEQRNPERRDRMHDKRVEERRDRAEPRPEVRDHLGDGGQRAEQQRVLLPVRQQARRRRAPRGRCPR